MERVKGNSGSPRGSRVGWGRGAQSRKIALIAAPWLTVPPRAYGGSEGVIDCLATGFVEAGHDVLLVTTGDSTCAVPKSWSRARSAPDQMGQSVVELHHLIHAYEQVADFDIVHDHTMLGPLYGQGRCRGQLVTTNHGPFTPEVNAIYGQAVPGTALIAISQDQASRSLAPVSAVIHHGVRPEDFPVGTGEGTTCCSSVASPRTRVRARPRWRPTRQGST